MRDNKGFTLVEIVVAMIVMVIVFAGVFVAFMSIGKVNVVSRVSQTQTNIATAILESFYDTKFHDINENMQFNLPEALEINKMSVDFSTSSSVKAEPINIKFDNISGVASTYSADVVVTPFSTDNDNGLIVTSLALICVPVCVFEGVSAFPLVLDLTTTIHVSFIPSTLTVITAVPALIVLT